MEELAAPAADINLIAQLHLVGILGALLMLGITWTAVHLITRTVTGLGDRFVDKRLLLNQIATIARFVVWTLGVFLAIRALDLSREIVIAFTGALGLMIGFALKDLAASVLAGLTIIIDRPFQVGDRVSFGEHYGEIQAIGLRSVRLVTLDDSLITIPNNKFLTDSVSSGNAGALDMLIQMDFFVGVDQNIAQARQLVEQSLLSSRYVYTRKPWVVLVSQIQHQNYVALRLRAKAYVLDVKYEKAFESDVTERVMEAFQKAGVLPPAVLHREIASARADEPASEE
ncbi:MAG: mechanosensitive ion channel [Nannocystaceae bacterium]